MSFVKDLFSSTVVGSALGVKSSAEKAAERAAGLQAGAAGAGIEEQRRQFDIATELQRPSLEAGDVARQELLASLGLSGEEAESQFFDRFKETRGQQFLRQQQEKSTLRTAASRGQLLGGNVLTALQEQAEGRAAGRLSQFQNRLAGLAGAGQTAATTTGQFGAQSGVNISNLLQQQSEAKASGIFGAQQARAGQFGNLLSLGSVFSDRRLKNNIKKSGCINGFNWYTWGWNKLAEKIGLHGDSSGVIADEIKLIKPGLVTRNENGYLMVNYSGLGV